MTWIVYLVAGYGVCLLLAWGAVKLADLCDRLIERMEAKR